MRRNAPSPRARTRARRRTKSSRALARPVPLTLVLIAAATAAVGLAFAGSPERLAAGVHVGGVAVGGLAPDDARALLERRSRALAHEPVTFVAGARRWRVTPSQLGVKVDWAAAVDAARLQGGGFGPVRGFRRLHTRFFGADVAPPTQVYDAALQYQVGRFASALDRHPRDAAVVLRGLTPAVVPGRSGRLLDRAAAERVVVRALAALSRTPIALPVRVARPAASAADVAPALAQARVALAAPVRLALGPTRWRLPRWRIAELLDLPDGGATKLRIGGPGADKYFARLRATVNRAPRDAGFAVSGSGVTVVAARAGRAVHVPRTARALLRAVVTRAPRLARVVVTSAAPERTTAEAKAMGITSLVGGYTTIYGGEPNRLHNVRLVAGLIDGALIAPGTTFSFNETTGERTAEKGFLEAPVIINGELQTGLGGGVCQVSTTVFNAAYESGLPIESRTNHALYIDHYPLGRDATVNYPDIDLRFTNDTKHWLLLRTFVGSSSLTVNLYGAPLQRRVVSEAAPLVVHGKPGVKWVQDPTLPVGETRVEDEGEPARSTSVHRRVYDASGKRLYDATWSSYYRSEPKIVRVGTKPPEPEPKPEPEPAPKAEELPGDDGDGESDKTPAKPKQTETRPRGVTPPR